MPPDSWSRRHLLRASAAASGVGTLSAAAEGVSLSDLPDLTIKEIRTHVVGRTRLACVVTESGIEGNYALQNRIWHANWDHTGWLDYAARTLIGTSALDGPRLTSQWVPVKRRFGQSAYAAAIDICLWDILGKAVGLPIYPLLGAYRDRMPAYASSQHIDTKTAKPYVEMALQAKAEGFRAFKINPPPVSADGDSHHRLDIKICREVREALGDEFMLIYGAAGNHGRHEAMEVGRSLDELHFVAYHDPLPSTDIDGYAELCQALDVPVVVGEFVFSIYDFPEYIRRRAAGMLRFVVDNIGGITGGMKIAGLAECCGMACSPHGVGSEMHQAAHLHCELAMPNAAFAEVPMPQGTRDQLPFLKDRIRVAEDGCVHAPVKPGLGLEIDQDALDNLTTEVEHGAAPGRGGPR